MSIPLSRSIGFILATAVCIVIAVIATPWFLILAVACLATAVYFYTQHLTHNRPTHTQPTQPQTLRNRQQEFRLNRRER